MASKEALTPRERVRLALSHQETDRVPISLICGELDEASRRALARYLGVDPGEGVDRYLSQFVDLVPVGPSFRGPDADYRGPRLERTPQAYEDVWGCRWEAVPYAHGVHFEITRYPLASVADPSELDHHRWPDPDWWDYEAAAERIAHAREERDYALIIASGNPFERTWWMRGFEQTLVDMVERPELYHAIISRITSIQTEMTRRLLEAAADLVDLAFTADDIAGQEGLLISLPLWEECVKPYHLQLNRVIHEFGVKVCYHSDGAVMAAIPGLIEMGVDVLQALQFSARGMDPVVLKERFGDRLCFEGGVSVQTTLPFGTPEEVRREVRHLISTLGRGGGYILGPSHTIEAPTPPENIVAMFEEAIRPG